MKIALLQSRPALTESLLLLIVMIALTVPFWLSPLDIMAAGQFYHPEQSGSFWPEENLALWNFLYQGAPILALVLLLGALGVLARCGGGSNKRLVRRRALFVLLSVILGPGLTVNMVFKDHYGRPRPRQIEQFQGHLAYQPPGLPGAEGKSFPCGHCSVGFVLWVFYFLSRRKYPLLATGIFLSAASLGILVGVGRMAAGGHFLSDILWSGFLSYGVCTLLYHALVGRWENKPVEQIPEFFLLARWQSLPPATRPWALGSVTVFLTLAGALAIPYKTQTHLTLPAQSPVSPTLTIQADVGDIVIRQTDTSNPPDIDATLDYRGFGLPSTRIDGTYLDGERTLQISPHGLFTEVEGRMELSLPAHFTDKLKIEARTGRIFLKPGVGAGWQLTAGRGVIYEPLLEQRFRK